MLLLLNMLVVFRAPKIALLREVEVLVVAMGLSVRIVVMVLAVVVEGVIDK